MFPQRADQLGDRSPVTEQVLIETNRIDPSLAEGYVALGELYLKMKRRDDAVRLFQEVLRWEPGNLAAGAHLKELGAKTR